MEDSLGDLVKLEMESLSSVLSKLSYEMTCYEILTDIMYLKQIKEVQDYCHILSLFDMDFEENGVDIELVLMTKICEIDEESELVHKVIEVVNLLSTCDSVVRPYEQPFVTEK